MRTASTNTGTFWSAHATPSTKVELYGLGAIAAEAREGLPDLFSDRSLRRSYTLQCGDQIELGVDYTAFRVFGESRSRHGTMDFSSATPDEDSWTFTATVDGAAPIAIRSKNGRVLVEGIDFFIASDGLFWRSSQSSYLAASRVHVEVGRLTHKWMPFVTQTQESAPNEFARLYARETQSIEAFRRLLAEECGAFVLPTDDTLVSVDTYGEEIVATFLRLGQVLIRDQAISGMVGQSLPKGFTTDTSIRVKMATSADDVREFYAPFEAVSLDLMLPFSGVFWETTSIFTCDVVDEGGSIRAYPNFSGPEDTLLNWRNNQRRQYERLGEYDLPAELLTVGAVEIPAEEILWMAYQRSLCLLSAATPDEHARLTSAVRRHRPAGVIFLINKIHAP